MDVTPRTMYRASESASETSGNGPRGGLGGSFADPTRRSCCTTSGQATAEFALTIGIVLILFFAVVDFGRMVAIHTAAVTASREAARYGSAIGDADGVAPPTPRYIHCDGIRQAARNVTGSLITLNADAVQIRYDNGITVGEPGYVQTTQPCPPLPGTGPVEAEVDSLDRVEVKVTVTYEAITPIRFLLGPITVVSTDRRTIVKP